MIRKKRKTERKTHMEKGKNYGIRHLALLTGLTDRTIRSYIAMGLLEGEKINGLWQFTPEQVERFLRHPAVRPSILAKNHSIVYDFLTEGRKKRKEACVILDLPGIPEKAAEFFCDYICAAPWENIRFSFDGVSGTPRVILRGETEAVEDILNAYRRKFPEE